MKEGFRCSACGEWHDELPLAYHVGPPTPWLPEHEDDPNSSLEDELCVIEGRHFFIRGLIRLPIRDAEDPFEWGVWVSLSEQSFDRTVDLWNQDGREAEPPMFGWLCSDLPTYERSTLGLETSVHTQPVGYRPLVQLDSADHPLAAEQRDGITMDRVRELAEQLLHDAGA